MTKKLQFAGLVIAIGFFLYGCKSSSQGQFSGNNKPKPLPTADATPLPTTTPVGALTKGSFTVWTEPKDPQPQQNYTIVVEVNLPSGTTNITQTDLTGCVIGSDEFVYALGRGMYTYGRTPSISANGTLQFTGADNGKVITNCAQLNGESVNNFYNYQNPQFSLSGTKAQLRIMIPGAQNLVKDNIQVHSAILNENQTFDIVF